MTGTPMILLVALLNVVYILAATRLLSNTVVARFGATRQWRAASPLGNSLINVLLRIGILVAMYALDYVLLTDSFRPEHNQRPFVAF